MQDNNRWDGWLAVAGGALVCFILGMGVMLEPTSLALATGMAVGVVVATPTVVIIAWVVTHRPKPTPPAPPAPATPPTIQQHLHIHLAPGQQMPATRGELLALLTQRTGSIEKARALIEAGRVTVE